MSKVTLSGYIVVPLQEIQAVAEALRHHIALTQQEPGCLHFTVTQRSNAPQFFDVYEEFVDRKAFNAHQQRVANSHWGNISQNVKRHYHIEYSD